MGAEHQLEVATEDLQRVQEALARRETEELGPDALDTSSVGLASWEPSSASRRNSQTSIKSIENQVETKVDVPQGEFEKFSKKLAQKLAKDDDSIHDAVLSFLRRQQRLGVNKLAKSKFAPFERGDDVLVQIDIVVQKTGSAFPMFKVVYKSSATLKEDDP